LFFFHVPKFRIFFKCWLPVLFWMIVIFAASSDAHSYEHSSRFIEPVLHWLFPQMPQAQIEEIHHFIRKCGHLTEYAVLALLLWRALRRSKNDRQVWSWRHARLVLLLVMLYADLAGIGCFYRHCGRRNRFARTLDFWPLSKTMVKLP
jgi:VanZ family protein